MSRENRRNPQDQLRTAIRRAQQVAEGLGREAFNRQPAAGSWSVGECLEHLNETARVYLPVLAEANEEGRSRGLLAKAGSGERTLLGRLVCWTQEPPPRFRMKTFDAITPESDLSPDTVLEAFEALHEELIVRANESADLNRRKIRVRSVLDPRLKLSLGDWYHFLAAHARRHLWQAEQARRAVEEAGPRSPSVDDR